MKKSLITLFLLASLTLPAFAADSTTPPAKKTHSAISQNQQAKTESFEQRKAKLLSKLDERIARLQQMRASAQAAKTPEELRACRQQFKQQSRHHQDDIE